MRFIYPAFALGHLIAVMVGAVGMAWFKAAGLEMLDTQRSGMKVRLGLAYVVRRGSAGVLTAYRVRRDNLALRALTRLPESAGQ